MTDIKYGVLYQLDGWHMVIKFPEGHEMISNEGYRTQEECRKAFDEWVAETEELRVKIERREQKT